jgi:hypothetical protein
MTEILSATLEGPRVQPLLAGLEAEYLSRYGEFRAPTGALLVLVAGDETSRAARCVAGPTASARSERVWTAPDHRRRGHGAMQTPAIEHRSAGCRRIPVYGRYAADPRCLCFEKASDGVVAIDITAPPVSIGSGTGRPPRQPSTRSRLPVK